MVTFVINGTSHTTLRHEIFKSMYYIFQYYEQRHKILKHCDDNHYAIATYFEDFWGGKQLFNHGKDTLTPIASQTRLLERVL